MLKKFLVFAICIGICFIIFLFYRQTANRSEHKETASRIYQPSVRLSPQKTQMLLKHFNSTELWFDPQKDYRTTRILQQARYIKTGTADSTSLASGVPITEERLSPQMSQINYTCQLAQFEPDIWFPQTATETREFVNLNNSHFLTGRKLTLQVHNASFNIPIPIKDLHLFPDR